MPEPSIELPQVYLQPGELYLARSPCVLKTLLGSCVGVTFWSPRLGLGALCHGVLPRCPESVRNSEGYRYVDFALCHLMRQLEGLGAGPGEVQVKVFGGADVLPVDGGRLRRATVGQQNCQSALEVLRRENYRVLTSDLAQELSAFSKDLFEQTLSLAADTDNHQQAIANVRRELSANLPLLRGEVELMGHDVDQTLSVVENVLRQQSAIPIEFRNSTQATWQQIVGVISAVQAHDITRQQIEHVQQAARDIASRMAESPEPTTFPVIVAALHVQAYQLTNIRQTVSIWREQARGCMLAIEQLSAAGILEVSADVLHEEQALSLRLSRIAALQQKSQDCCGRMQSTLGGLSSLMELINGHLNRAEAIRDHLHILMMNALIEAEHLNARGAVVSAIASLIKEVSADWSARADRSRLRLTELADLVRQMASLFEAFSDASRDQLRPDVERTRTGLDTVHATASRVSEEAFKMKVVTERMGARSAALGQTRSRLDVHFGRLDSARQAIEGLQHTLLKADARATVPCDNTEVERWLAAAYTTESERQVLAAALYGHALPSAQTSFAGNEVELF